MILLEPVGSADSRNVTMLFARLCHFITARESNCGYPRSVLSLLQGVTILFSVKIMDVRFNSVSLVCT